MADFKQAIPNPDPGLKTTPRGYLNPIYKIKTETAILEPNESVLYKNTSQLVITLPNLANYKPEQDLFNKFDPSMYRRIRYYVNQNILYREVITYNSNGSQNSKTETPIAEPHNGTITLKFEDIPSDSKSCYMTVIIRENPQTRHSAEIINKIRLTALH
jgi:hypothetical protein